MPPRIVIILDRLKRDLADELSCRRHRAGMQAGEILLAKATARPGHYGLPLHPPDPSRATLRVRTSSTSADGTSPRRPIVPPGDGSPLAVIRRLAMGIAERCRTATTAGSTWIGHRVWLLDGSAFSMPDTPELQRRPSASPAARRRGAASRSPSSWRYSIWLPGCSCESSPAPLRSHEMSRCAVATSGLLPGDVVLGDRGFCSYAHLAILLDRKASRGVPCAPASNHRLHSGPGASGPGQGEEAS